MMSDPEEEDGVSSGRLTRRTASLPQFAPGNKACVFCGEIEKRIPKKNTVMKTSQMLTDDAESTLREAATIRNDEKMLIAISGVSSLIAREVCYHKTCYRDYTRKSTLERIIARRQSGRGINPDEPAGHDDVGIVRVTEFVEEEVLEKKTPVSISHLVHLYAERAGTESSSMRADKLKEKIRCLFGDRLAFSRPSRKNMPEVVYAAGYESVIIADLFYGSEPNQGQCNVSPEEVDDSCGNDEDIEYSSSPAQQSSNATEQDDVRVLYHAARVIRCKVVESAADCRGDGISPDDSARCIPDSLYNVLVWIISEDYHDYISAEKICPVGPSLQRAVLSIGQDVLFATNNVPSPKHVVLAMSLHHLYRSAKLITILNRLSHCIAYDQVLERETLLAEKKMRDGGHIDALPNIIDRTKPFFHVADNNDLCEETLDGRGTTHCTNTIIIQPHLPGAEPQPVEPVCIPRPCHVSQKRKRAVEIEPEAVPDVVCSSKVNPPPFIALSAGYDEPCTAVEAVVAEDFAWVLCRASSGNVTNVRVPSQENPPQSVPEWTAFNALASRHSIPAKSAIAYCPVIDASPTDLSTVYSLLHKCLHRCDSVGLPFCLLVLDQAIYAKAMDIVLSRPQEFSRVVLRMGAFHIASTFLAVIGKRFRDAGLLDILVESQVAGSAAASAALDGRQYNRGVHFHKVVAEAMERKRLVEFLGQSSISSDTVNNISKALSELQHFVSADNLTSVTTLPNFSELHHQYLAFCEEKSKSFPNFHLWSSYIAMVNLLLRFIRSTRTANWELHLACLLEILPWCFAYDRQNYARFLSLYWLQMKHLQHTHPEADEFLKRGGFTAQRSDNPFAQVASDMAIEQSINRATKTRGGIIGFSRSTSAVQRWVLTAHDRGEIAEVCMQHCGLDASSQESQALHKECQQPRMERGEVDVLRVCSTLDTLVNPFVTAGEHTYSQLVSLSSCEEASGSAAGDLLSAEARGRECFESFIRERLTADPPLVRFHDPLKRLNLETFTVKKKKRKSSSRSAANSILQGDRSVFSRFAVIAQTRQMDLRELLRYPLGPLPWALASQSGTLVKTNKAAILPLLFGTSEQAAFPDHLPLPPTSAVMLDAMALLRTIKQTDIPATFGELAEHVFKRVCHYHGKHQRVDFVVDTYQPFSIKNMERMQRSSSHGSVKQHIASASQPAPKQFTKYLSVGSNKEELVAFFMAQWSMQQYGEKILPGKVLIVTAGMQCVELTSQAGTIAVRVVEDLESSHEEADTRLLLHAYHASSAGYPKITIKSPDTDVAVLACHFSRRFPNTSTLFFETGVGTKHRLVNITEAADSLGHAMCNALPGLHAFTGCDSISAFAFRGKRFAFDLLGGTSEESVLAREAMSSLGMTFNELSENELKALEGFTCQLYKAPKCTSVNDARYELFCLRNLQSNQLPPCRDALILHSKRANYQAAVWRQALVAKPDVPEPNGHGWTVGDGGTLAIEWTTIPPAPRAILEFLCCNCSSGCKDARCSCRRHRLVCTDVCRCTHKKDAAQCLNCSEGAQVDVENSDDLS